MDMGAPGIGPEQAFEIAKEIQKGERKEIPNWLNRTEKEMVEASLDFLLATDKALKTWWVKSNYLEKRKESIEAMKRTFSTLCATSEAIGTINTLAKQAAELYKEERGLAADLHTRFLKLEAEYMYNVLQVEGWGADVIKAAKSKNKDAMFRKWHGSPGGRIVGNALTAKAWSAARNWGKWGGPNMTEQAERLVHGFQKEAFRKAYGIISGLSPAGQALSREFMRKYNEFLKEIPAHSYVPLGLAVMENGDVMGQINRVVDKTVPAWERVAKKRRGEAEDWKIRCKFAGTFYIIAAMGEFMEDLARSIG